MRAYMEVKDILFRTKYGTQVRLLDLLNGKVIATFEMGKFDYKERLPREVLEGEPVDFCAEDNCLTITLCKDED